MAAQPDTRKVFEVEFVSTSPLATRRTIRLLADDEAEARHASRYYRKCYEETGKVEEEVPTDA